MITIYHNPRCSKSREGLNLIKDSGQDFEIRDYTKDPLSEKEIRALLKSLKMVPMELIRTDEKVWKENYKGKDLNDDELIQRPIVVKDEKAVVGRPSENISDLLK